MGVRASRVAWLQLGLLAILTPWLCGCSKTGGDVKGTVTFNGKPLNAGTVGLVGADGKNAAGGNIEPDGSYYISKPPKGTYTIVVETFDPPSTGSSGSIALPPGVEASAEKKAELEKTSAPKRERMLIPTKYKDPKTSGLSITVSGSSQTFNIDLVGEAPAKSDKK
ncbi:MAG TPA: hypothetical protein VKS79_00025 [Gemmataceae bacterium]|nr:hypothetical protein [Gemmataceae bacterium]